MNFLKAPLAVLIVFFLPLLGFAQTLPAFHPISTPQGFAFGVTQNTAVSIPANTTAGIHTYKVYAANGTTLLGEVDVDVTATLTYTIVAFRPN